MSKRVEIHELQARLGEVPVHFQKNLAATLNAAVPDFSIFRDMTADGAFIGSKPSLSLFTTKITKILKTYMVSHALQAKNMVITVARILTPYDFYHREESKWRN